MNQSDETPKNQVVEKLKGMSDEQIIPVLIFLAGMDAGEKFTN